MEHVKVKLLKCVCPLMELVFAACALKSLMSLMAAMKAKMLHVPSTVIVNAVDGYITVVWDISLTAFSAALNSSTSEEFFCTHCQVKSKRKKFRISEQ